MKIEDIKPGKKYVINTAPLIASFQPTDSTFIGEVHHVNGDKAYVDPPNGSMLYISAHWFVKEAEEN